jgi:hypothetical protein
MVDLECDTQASRPRREVASVVEQAPPSAVTARSGWVGHRT